jgi:hypothetical protein
VVAVAMISEMMNCVLEWTFSIDMNDDGGDDNEPLIFRYPTQSNSVDGMSIREEEHVWAVTVIRMRFGSVGSKKSGLSGGCIRFSRRSYPVSEHRVAPA